MKFAVLLVPLALAGCHTAAPRPLPLPTTPAALPASVITPPAVANSVTHIACEQKLRQQRQFIEALMSQNDALTTKLDALPSLPAAPVEEAPAIVAKLDPRTETPQPVTPPVPPAPSLLPPPALTPAQPEILLAPNAEGIIDLAALTVLASEPTNPFAVRSAGPDATRDLVLTVNGIVGGASPVALVNGRAVQVGETIESLMLERCEPDAAIFRRGEHRLRLAVDPKPVRIRGAL